MTARLHEFYLIKGLHPNMYFIEGLDRGTLCHQFSTLLRWSLSLKKIRQDISISGLHIPNKGIHKLLAFADDTNFFTKDTRSIKLILDNFNDFGKASGSLININNTK